MADLGMQSSYVLKFHWYTCSSGYRSSISCCCIGQDCSSAGSTSCASRNKQKLASLCRPQPQGAIAVRPACSILHHCCCSILKTHTLDYARMLLRRLMYTCMPTRTAQAPTASVTIGTRYVGSAASKEFHYRLIWWKRPCLRSRVLRHSCWSICMRL